MAYNLYTANGETAPRESGEVPGQGLTAEW